MSRLKNSAVTVSVLCCLLLVTPNFLFGADNPFEGRTLDNYYGKWVEEKGKMTLLLYGADRYRVGGLLIRGTKVMDVVAEVRNGVLAGYFGIGNDKFDFTAKAASDRMEFEAGTFAAKLVRQKERSFVGVYAKGGFAMEIQEAGNQGLGGAIKIRDKTYMLSAKSRGCVVWGEFYNNEGRWPFFAHWTGAETLSFHTGNYVEENVISKTIRGLRIEAEKKAAKEKREKLFGKVKTLHHDLAKAREIYDALTADLKRYFENIPHGLFTYREDGDVQITVLSKLAADCSQSNAGKIELAAGYDINEKGVRDVEQKVCKEFYDMSNRVPRYLWNKCRKWAYVKTGKEDYYEDRTAKDMVTLDFTNLKYKDLTTGHNPVRSVAFRFEDDIVKTVRTDSEGDESVKYGKSFLVMYAGDPNPYEIKEKLGKYLKDLQKAFKDYQRLQKEYANASSDYKNQYKEDPVF
jgi:hypothetical protein